MLEKKSYSKFIGGILFCLFGAVCFSTKAIFVKLAYRDTEVDAITLLALRMLFSLPFFTLSAIFSSNQRSNVRFTGKQWIGVALVGCLGYYVSSLLDFLGLQYISAGIERLVLFIYPTLVLLMTSVIFKVKISTRQWFALAITYAGLFIAFWGEVSFQGGTGNFYKGAALVFVCAVTYAMNIVGSGRLIPTLGAAKFNSYAMSFAAIAVLIHFFVTSDNSLLDQSYTVYFYSFSMAIISTVIPSYLLTEGIKRTGSGNAAIVGSVGPVSTILQAYFFLNEPMHAMQLAGTALILAGVLMISSKKLVAV
ncbi:MAG: DMT family transporter [Cyclobacteriaceae bacterium]|nr:DMT family transporter [Cyclobacteriaceae bacterium]MDH4294940.1 DMT family transporter [Cyclobacteriaceae bacterium]MDH5251035.1 DMT family transporter [Cyclobacteriaceae bacterium]